MLGVIKDVPTKPGQKVPEEIIQFQIEGLKSRIDDVLGNNEIRNSDTVFDAFGDTLKTISEKAIL